MPENGDRSHLCLKKTTNLIKQITGLSVLPVLNNIYERLLAVQLGEFYSAILSDFISSYRKFYSCETALLQLTEDGGASMIGGTGCNSLYEPF